MTGPFDAWNAANAAARRDYAAHPFLEWTYNPDCRCHRCEARRRGWRNAKARAEQRRKST